MPRDFFIKGLDEVKRAFAELPKNVARKVVRQSLRNAMKPMLSAAKEDAPEGATGDLERSIKLRAGRKKRNTVTMNIVSFRDPGDPTGYHSAFVEFGTSKQAPQGFFRKAFDQTKGTTMAIALGQLMSGIQREVRGLAHD